jgi:hypothetical protein
MYQAQQSALYYQPTQPRPSGIHPISWISFGLGIVGVAGIPIPILNNMTAIFALIGVVLGIVGGFKRGYWLAVASVALCMIALVGTIAIQVHWSNELNEIINDAPTFEEYHY